jgi:hypothetical protein
MKLNKSIPLLLILFNIFICGLYYGTVNANPSETPPSFEEGFKEVGYKSAKAAVKDFENHFKSDVKLPETLPSISFTHQFGRFFEDKNDNVNNFLEIRFVHKDIRDNIFKIDIRPSKNKLNFENKLNLNGKVYTLHDGSKGIYFEDRLFNFFVFEKNNLQYIFGLYNKAAITETPDILVRIANSID